MNKRKNIVPNNLKEFRLKANLTQKQVSNFLGFTSEDRICHWEKGHNVPSLENLFKLSILYKIEIPKLYEELLKRLN